MMCLERITQRENLPKTKTGWKVFNFCFGKLVPEFRGSEPYQKGKWYDSKQRTPYYALRDDFLETRIRVENYPNGFHVFTKKEDAINWAEKYQKVRKVKCKEIFVMGIGCNGKEVFVAGKMKIPR